MAASDRLQHADQEDAQRHRRRTVLRVRIQVFAQVLQDVGQVLHGVTPDAGRRRLVPLDGRHEHALLEVALDVRARGGARVVRDHHDRLLEVAVQRLQQVQDLLGALRVEVAGRLVGHQHRRVGDDGARDGDALLLSARELPRVVLASGRPGRRP